MVRSSRFVDYETWKSDKIEGAIRSADASDFATDDEMDEVFERYRPVPDQAE